MRFLFVLTFIFLLAGCGGRGSAVPTATAVPDVLPSLTPVALAPGERLRVLATTSLVGDVVAAVAGEAAEVTVLLPAGTDPHSFNPTPADARLLADADVVFINGLGLEGWLDQVLALSEGGARPVVALSVGIVPRGATHEEGEEEHEGEAAHEEGEDEHAHGAHDPHVWFDPANVKVWVANAAQSLSALDPANAATYAANAAAYTRELDTVAAEMETLLAPIPPERRVLVTNHDNLGYFADRYGFTIVGTVIPSLSSEAEPSAADLATLTARIREMGAPAIFVESTASPRLAETVARETGARVVPLFTDSLGGPGSGAERYLDMMRLNAARIAEALR